MDLSEALSHPAVEYILGRFDEIVDLIVARPVLAAACAVAFISLVTLLIMHAKLRRVIASQPTQQDIAYVRRKYENSGPIFEEMKTRPDSSNTQPSYAPTTPDNGAPGNSAPRTVLGWLEFPGTDAEPFPLTLPQIRIGRADDSDVILSHNTVHRHHAMLQLGERNTFELVDQGGANGCVVNGERYARRELKNGDMVELGDVRLRFHDGGSVPR